MKKEEKTIIKDLVKMQNLKVQNILVINIYGDYVGLSKKKKNKVLNRYVSILFLI